MILYNLRRTTVGFLLGKFDNDFNVEAVYELTPKRPGADPMFADAFNCNCPAGPRPSCKHRKMIFVMRKNVDTEWFLCYETQMWHRPLAPLGEGLTEAIEATDPEVPAQIEPTPPPPSEPSPTFRRRL